MIIMLSTPPKTCTFPLYRKFGVHIHYCGFSKLGAAEKKVAAAAEVPPKKPPRRMSSVTMKKPMNTETTVDDVDHEYEVIH